MTDTRRSPISRPCPSRRGSINTRLPTPARALAALAALVVVTLALGGCGADASEQIRAEVQQLAQATADRSYGLICDQILAPSLVAHLVSNGIPCVQALKLGLGGVRNPVVSVGKVVIRGSRAWAITLSSARGQRAELVAIELNHTGQGWRITSLASPLSAVQGR